MRSIVPSGTCLPRSIGAGPADRTAGRPCRSRGDGRRPRARDASCCAPGAANTVNPPGNERAAQEQLAGLLGDAGFEVELLGRTEQRPNLVARLRGTGDGPTLCLLSHVDTVLADAGEWQHDPWSGDVVDGVLWGRGALDMKSQTAAEVVAAVDARARGLARRTGDLLVVVRRRRGDRRRRGRDVALRAPPRHRALRLPAQRGRRDAVIPFDGERVYGVCVAEKGVFRFKLRTRGVAGHASMPKIGDNALLKLAPLLQAMGERQPRFDVTDGAAGAARRASASTAIPRGLEELRARDPCWR